MKVLKNFNLIKYNAFKVNILAKYFAEIKNVNDIKSIIENPKLGKEGKYILGQGFNTLFTKNYDGLILKVDIKGKKIVKETDKEVVLELGAGEDWINLVEYALKHNWSGIENLSFIPGSVGAAPVQNIAAYGQNFDEVFVSLDAVNLNTGEVKAFNKNECEFGYRESIFKNKLKGKYIITKVRIKLSKETHIDTSYHSRYGSIEGELAKFAKPQYTISDVSKAVISIRSAKLPDWKKVGTAGSFFLNPVITKKKLGEVQKIAPGVQFYPIDKLTYPQPNDPTFDHANYVKVAAGWLFEELGWKGKRIGDVGTSPNQSLVVINYGNASTNELLSFTNKMKNDFEDKYKIKLEPEVNIV
jgi:UDP-N-acetylmuramate dehydrogenase